MTLSTIAHQVVTDAEQASLLWCRYRDENRLGSSDLKRDSGRLVATSGETIGHVSYNGRVWNADGSLMWESR